MIRSTPMNSFSSKAHITASGAKLDIYRLDALVRAKVGDVATLPYSLRILLENLLRYEDGKTVQAADIKAVAGWNPSSSSAADGRGGRTDHEVQIRPARV